MDNPLTPNKILRLLHYAEDKNFSARKLLPQKEQEHKRTEMQECTTNKSNIHFESSSGILDLDKVEGFGESGSGAMSLSKSTTFNPGEMTGRSTGTEDVNALNINLGTAKTHDMFEDYGRYSFALENFTSNLDKQTLEVNDIMRHSIATNYSFNVKRDLTADEASFVIKQAPIPVQPSAQVNITTDNLDNNTDMSMGSYFKNRCPEFSNMLGKSDSPSRLVHKTSEVSSPSVFQGKETINFGNMDQSLDCVPVRQSRCSNNEEIVQVNESTFNINRSNHTNVNYVVSELSDNSCSIDKPPVKDMFKHPLGKAKEVLKVPSRIEQKLLQQRLLKSLNAEQFLKIAHTSSFPVPTEESATSVDNENENSLSISKIADYLGKQSNVSIMGMLQLNKQKNNAKKQPLTELHMNDQNNTKIDDELPVSHLKDTRNIETASTMETVISLNKLKINEEIKVVPPVTNSHQSNKNERNNIENRGRALRCKSPSSKSHSTLSTVQENFTSFKSNDSPLHNSKGENNLTQNRSPNVEYKELDKSVDWYEVLQYKQTKPDSLPKEQWAEIKATSVNGYVGASTAATISVTTLTDSWLTAKFRFDNLPNDGKDMTIELPRQPLLLSPGRTEQLTLHLASNVEMNTTLTFTVHLKDASIDGDVEQTGSLDVNFKMPTIHALSCDGINTISFHHVQESTSLTKYLVVISYCPVDLQLELSIVEGDSLFTIINVQEISKGDTNKAMMDRPTFEEDQHKIGKPKGKILNKQLCRLTSGNAIKVSIKFTAPKLLELNLCESKVAFKGALHINLIGIQTIIKKVDLMGVVGTAKLEVDIPNHILQITNEPKTVLLRNTGYIAGSWIVSVKEKCSSKCNTQFQVSTLRVDIRPGGESELVVAYTGLPDELCEAVLVLEDVVTGNKTTVNMAGGGERPKTFPIKTNYVTMSWVRAGRKELSLRNSSNKKIQIRCQIFGDGFSIDLPGAESRGTYCLSFGPHDCRPLPVMFAPSSCAPHAAALHLAYDKNSDFSRKVKLFGCAGGEPVRWSGLVTYGDTALVRAAVRQPITLTLYNKGNVPTFLCAKVHFNLQYHFCEESSRLEGAYKVVGARRKHAVSLVVEWARVERRARAVPAGALATLTVLAGPEYTRRRILRIIRNQTTGELDTSLLPDHLKVLALEYEGQDIVSDESLKDFEETMSSFSELMESLQELTAQIDLPQDFADENTIIISDDTIVNHHTLCD